MAEERRLIWKDWASGGSNSELYDMGHLPYILMHYRQVWDPQSCLNELDIHSDRLSGSLLPQQRGRVVSSGDDSEEDLVVDNSDQNSKAMDAALASLQKSNIKRLLDQGEYL